MRWNDEVDQGSVIYIGHHLRKEDRQEVYLSDRVGPREAVLRSWQDCDFCRLIETDDGVPAGLTGVTENKIWMLGTPELTATKKGCLQLVREGRVWVDHCLKEVGGPLWNDVYAKNTQSIAWLKALHFQVGQPRPLGESGALFCIFWRTP